MYCSIIHVLSHLFFKDKIVMLVLLYIKYYKYYFDEVWSVNGPQL